MNNSRDEILKKLRETDGFRNYYGRILTLLSSGSGWHKALCPFHDDHNPSLSVNLVTGRFRCFGCQKRGDVFDFRIAKEGLTFEECCKVFEGELGIKLHTESCFTSATIPAMEQVKRWHQELYSPRHSAVLDFLHKKRGLTDNTIQKFNVGYISETQSVSIPIIDHTGQKVIAVKRFRYDLVTGEKTIQSNGRAQLFGAHLLRDYADHQLVVVCEGELDAMVLNQNGVLAVSGSAGAGTWKEEWNKYFSKKNVVICYDSDDAGRMGAHKVARSLQAYTASIRCMDLFGDQATRELKDVTDYFVKVRKSADDFRRAIESSVAISSLLLGEDRPDDPQARLPNPRHDQTDGIIDSLSQAVCLVPLTRPNWLNGKEMLILAKALPPVSDLLQHILREKSLNFLAGETGSGKSILAMDLGISVAIGAKRFLAWDIVKTGKVIYINFEIYFEDFVRRCDMMCQRLPVAGPVENLIACSTTSSLVDIWPELEEILRKEKPCLVIIDPLYFAHDEDESDNSKMKDLVRRLCSLRDTYNTCVLVVHHTRKWTQGQKLHNDMMRGAGVFGAASDTVLMMRRSEKEPRVRIIRATKLRHAADRELTARSLILDEWLWFQDTGEANEEEHLGSSDDEPKIVKAEPIETQVLEAILRARHRVERGILINVMITDAYNSVRNRSEHITPKSMSSKLKDLGFDNTKSPTGGFAIYWNEVHFRSLCDRYGVKYTPPSASSETSASYESSDASGLDGFPEESEDTEVPEGSEVQTTPIKDPGSPTPEPAEPAVEKNLLHDIEEKLKNRPDLIEILRRQYNLDNCSDEEVIRYLDDSLVERAGMEMCEGLSQDAAEQAAVRQVLGEEVLTQLNQSGNR